MIKPAYQYRALLERVIDADTLKLRIDLGFGAWIVVTVRVRGVDAAEMNTPLGQKAAAAVGALLESADVVVVTYKDQMSFARWVADVYVNGILLADWLQNQGFT